MAAALVLDSFALLALLRDEPGGETVAQMLERAGERDQPVHMTEVHYAEVQYLVRRTNGEKAWAGIAGKLKAVPIEFHPADRRLSNLAAEIKIRHKISLTDAFAAALAKVRKAELVTANAGFKSLEKEIKIHWLKKT